VPWATPPPTKNDTGRPAHPPSAFFDHRKEGYGGPLLRADRLNSPVHRIGSGPIRAGQTAGAGAITLEGEVRGREGPTAARRIALQRDAARDDEPRSHDIADGDRAGFQL